MSSVDFRAFVQAELDESQRRTDVYQGATADLGAPAEHMTIDHLEKLLSGTLSQELRSLYMAEYSEIRAALRSVAVCGLSRKDFYDEACYQTIRETDYLKSELSAHAAAAVQFSGRLEAGLQDELAATEAEYEERKSEVVDRLHASTGTPSSETMKDADVVSAAMKDVNGVNPRGVTSSSKRIS